LLLASNNRTDWASLRSGSVFYAHPGNKLNVFCATNELISGVCLSHYLHFLYGFRFLASSGIVPKVNFKLKLCAAAADDDEFG